MDRRQPTLEDVARAAGVSRSTVSRVVNGRGEVAPEVRRRVQQTVTRMSYRPHSAARALASGRPEVLDLVVIENCAETFGSNPYYTRVVAGMLRALTGTEVQARLRLVAESGADATLADIATATGLGALLVNVPAPLAERFYLLCDRVVSLGRSAPDVPFIDPENAVGAGSAVRHLYGCGRRRIAAVHGPRYNPSADSRRLGYLGAINDAGLTPVSVDGEFTRETGLLAAQRLLAARPDIDAIFAACDLMATGVLQALAESGRRVPDDVAVVGFDDSLLADCAIPPLTSVRQPVEEITGIATEALLLRKVRRRWQRIMPTSLTVRRSTSCC